LSESGADAVLISAMELFTSEPLELNRYFINEIPELVNNLRQLIRNGSWKLGESIIKSTKPTKEGDLDKAIYEMNRFKSSLRPNWVAFENRHEDAWENFRGVGTRALPAGKAACHAPGGARAAPIDIAAEANGVKSASWLHYISLIK
jgi:hypothetical protein